LQAGFDVADVARSFAGGLQRRRVVLLLRRLRRHFQESRSFYDHIATSVLILGMFVAAMTAVFYGFCAYYIRISLLTEFQSKNPPKSLDYVYTRVIQMEKDEVTLRVSRTELATLTQTACRKS
jgi:hypothetical protein